MNTGCHCEVWIINHLTGDTKLGNVFVLYEHLPLEIIYHVTVRLSGLYIHGQHCGWVWDNPLLEALVNSYLMEIQATREEIISTSATQNHPFPDIHTPTIVRTIIPSSFMSEIKSKKCKKI